MNQVNIHALLVRAFKTFIQAGLAAWALTGYNLNKGVVGGIVAAGISAVMNLFLQPQEAK